MIDFLFYFWCCRNCRNLLLMGVNISKTVSILIFHLIRRNLRILCFEIFWVICLWILQWYKSYCRFRILLCFWLRLRRRSLRRPARACCTRWTRSCCATGQWSVGSRGSPRCRRRRWSWTRNWGLCRPAWRRGARWPSAGRRAGATPCRWSRRWPARARGCPRPCFLWRSRPQPRCAPSLPRWKVCGPRRAALRCLLSRWRLASRRRWRSRCCCLWCTLQSMWCRRSRGGWTLLVSAGIATCSLCLKTFLCCRLASITRVFRPSNLRFLVKSGVLPDSCLCFWISFQ